MKKQHASQIAGFATVVIAAVALVGWWWDLPLLSGWGAGLPATTPFGALCLAVVGLVLMRRHDDILPMAVGLALAAVAAVDLGLALFSDQPAGLEALFAMPAATALGVILAGGALTLSRFEQHYIAAAVLGGLAGAIAVFGLLGYVTGTNTLYNAASMSSPPLPTAVALLFIAFGIILRIGAKPEFRRPRPLWHLLAVLGWAIVVPLLLFGAYGSGRLADAQLDQVRRGMIDEVTNVSSDVDREILGEIETLQTLAASPSLQNGDFASFQRQAEAPLTLRQSGSIELFDRDARQIVNTSAPFGTPMPQEGLREQVERAFATGKTQITNLYETSVGKFQYSIILPVKIDGEFRYALARSPSDQALARVLGGNQLPPSWKAVVFDAAHRIIAQSQEEVPEAIVGKKLPPSQWGRDGSGIVDFADSEGRPSLEAYHQSELTGWSTAMWATKAVLGAPLQALWQALGWMALLAFSLVVGLALWVGRIISQSVGHAARAAVALGEGRALPPNGTPVAEVNTLMAELQETAAKRQAAEDILRDREWRLQLALAAAQLGSWQYDPARRVLSGDARAKEILDFPGNELVVDALMARVHPEDGERVAAAFVGSLDPANTKRPATEFRLRHRDGKIRWLETLGLVHFEGTGPERRAVSIVGTVADITVRKQLEEESKARVEKEHLLMREMNHRAKNMLSVVDAIAHQTATRTPEHFVERFSERIQSLSASQDLLVRNEWKGVEIKGLVHAQLAHFADLIGSRISVGGPELRLKEASAQAIGLALHELATNAGKYGALSTDTGHVNVCWEADDDAFTMSWAESGGPPVSPPKRRGFGTIVMGVMAERSVCGDVALDYAPSGVTWRLACPAANALETADGLQSGEREQLRAERLSA